MVCRLLTCPPPADLAFHLGLSSVPKSGFIRNTLDELRSLSPLNLELGSYGENVQLSGGQQQTPEEQERELTDLFVGKIADRLVEACRVPNRLNGRAR